MLLSLYVSMKNYLECLEHGYMGEISPYEKTLADEMKDTLLKMESTCLDYFKEEGRIIGE
jgi:hypothetical protein